MLHTYATYYEAGRGGPVWFRASEVSDHPSLPSEQIGIADSCGTTLVSCLVSCSSSQSTIVGGGASDCYFIPFPHLGENNTPETRKQSPVVHW